MENKNLSGFLEERREEKLREMVDFILDVLEDVENSGSVLEMEIQGFLKKCTEEEIVLMREKEKKDKAEEEHVKKNKNMNGRREEENRCDLEEDKMRRKGIGFFKKMRLLTKGRSVKVLAKRTADILGWPIKIFQRWSDKRRGYIRLKTQSSELSDVLPIGKPKLWTERTTLEAI